VPGDDAPPGGGRARALLDRIARLDEREAGRLLRQTLRRFGGRHADLEATLRHHADLVRHRVAPDRLLSPTARLLAGAYFSHEYAVEAAALCNPSMVAHPDQTGLAAGQLRVVISLRQIGEGHLSSIGFATGILGPGDRLQVAERSGPLLTGGRSSTRHRRDLLAADLAEDGWADGITTAVLGSLPDRFDDGDVERAVAGLPEHLLAHGAARDTLDRLRRAVAAGYAVTFPGEVPLDRRVLWPATAAERNGMEDARFVRFVDDGGGSHTFRATYTAYDGRDISGRMLESPDLRHFEMTPLRGPGAGNKGMALFPRPVAGQHLALCRCDGETMGLTTLDAHHRWQAPVPLHAPAQAWELVQVGNCGSPLETAAGWLVLTHGVGPMRRYAIGALLLDLHHPHRVVAHLPHALLAPAETERDGYVPNVVYSCGALLHAGAVWLPYGVSDSRIGFATVRLAALLAVMRRAPGPPAPPP
jgi:predicted GH43/DUF377 family glycosyl hydrolase